MELTAALSMSQLAEVDDVTLVQAADDLRYARAHYFEGQDTSTWSVEEYMDALQQQERMRHIESTIWALLARRYGCND